MKKFVYLIASIINSGITALLLYMSPYVILPMHYGINGNADRYASKWEIMIYTLFPIVISIIYLIYSIIIEKKNSKNQKVMDKIFFIGFVYIFVILWYMMALSLQCKPHLSNSYFAMFAVIMGVMLMLMSNFIPKARQNNFFGIRIKATLSSQTTWNKTHRLAGVLGIIGSLALMICGILGVIFESIVVYLFLSGIGIYFILGVIIPCIYANVIAKKEKNNG
ncbi:MAG: SdpI family protein [Ruminococcus sp.]|nr:SdpI family protein [Ruminococcus sp.]